MSTPAPSNPSPRPVPAVAGQPARRRLRPGAPPTPPGVPCAAPAVPISRQQLAFVFWPETTDQQALKNLRTLLTRLRRALPDADRRIEVTAQTICWRSGADVAADSGGFLNAVAASQEHGGAAGALAHAVEAYGGELLPDCYDDWIVPLREQFHHAYGDALERLILILEEQREYSRAIGYARRLLHHDPLHEAAYDHLMRLHAALGDRSEVLRVYRACETMLAQEFGTAPARSIRDLYERVRETDERAPVPGVEPQPASACGASAGGQECGVGAARDGLARSRGGPRPADPADRGGGDRQDAAGRRTVRLGGAARGDGGGSPLLPGGRRRAPRPTRRSPSGCAGRAPLAGDQPGRRMAGRDRAHRARAPGRAPASGGPRPADGGVAANTLVRGAGARRARRCAGRGRPAAAAAVPRRPAVVRPGDARLARLPAALRGGRAAAARRHRAEVRGRQAPPADGFLARADPLGPAGGDPACAARCE